MKLLVALAICTVCVSGEEKASESLKRQKRGWGYETTTEGWTIQGWTTQGWTTEGWTTPPAPTKSWGWPEPTTEGWGWQPGPTTKGWGWQPKSKGWGGSVGGGHGHGGGHGGGDSVAIYPVRRYPYRRSSGGGRYRRGALLP